MSSPISVANVANVAAGRGSAGSDDADDDRAPFLSSPGLPTVQGGGAPYRRQGGGRSSRWASLVDGARAALRRLPRPRRQLARVATSAGLRGLCRGLALCLLLLAVGAVGSFALRQVVSPEIEALERERQELRAGLELLRTQLHNMTRVADIRLDTIHLLESELEKQAVQAGEAAAAALANGTRLAHGALAGDLRGGRVAPNLVYTALLGSLVFLFVLYRVVRIMQGELLAHRKLVSGRPERGGPPSSASPSPPRSLRGILVDDDLAPSPGADASTRSKPGGAALGLKAGPGSECYKRPQGDRLIV